MLAMKNLKVWCCRYFREVLNIHGGDVDTPGPAQFAAVAESRRWPRPAAAQAGVSDGRIPFENYETPAAGLKGPSFNVFRNGRASGAGVHNRLFDGPAVNAEGLEGASKARNQIDLPSEFPVNGWDAPRSTRVNEDSAFLEPKRHVTGQQRGGSTAEVVLDSGLNSRAETKSGINFRVDSILAGSDAEEVEESAEAYAQKKSPPAEIIDEENGYHSSAAHTQNRTINSLQLLPVGLDPEENLEVISRMHQEPLAQGSTVLPVDFPNSDEKDSGP
jgi:hypothetical protein